MQVVPEGNTTEKKDELIDIMALPDLTADIVELGADYFEYIVVQNFGTPLKVKIKPLTDVQMDLVSRTNERRRGESFMLLVKASGKSVEELKSMPAKERMALIEALIKDNKLPTEVFDAEITYFRELCRFGISDTALQEKVKDFRYGLTVAIGEQISRISSIPTDKLINFIKDRGAKSSKV